MRGEPSPIYFIEMAAKMDVIIEMGILHFILDVLIEVKQTDPATFVFYVVVPFFVIAVVGAVEIKHVIAEEEEF